MCYKLCELQKMPMLLFLFLQPWKTCAIGCEFRSSVTLEGTNKADAIFGLSNEPSIESVIRSMESAQYYPENNIDNAHG